MPIPTQELKLEIVNAAIGQPLGARAAPDGRTGRSSSATIPKTARARSSGSSLPCQARRASRLMSSATRSTARCSTTLPPRTAALCAEGGARADKKTQQWHLVPVDNCRLFVHEGAADGAVLDLADAGKDDTRIVLGEYDDSAESQRWRLVPGEPERTSDLVLDWAPLSHWNSRQSWRLTHDKSALRPTADATPSFSNVLLALQKFGCDRVRRAGRSPAAEPPPCRSGGLVAGLRRTVPRRHHRNRARGHRRAQTREGGRSLSRPAGTGRSTTNGFCIRPPPPRVPRICGHSRPRGRGRPASRRRCAWRRGHPGCPLRTRAARLLRRAANWS